MLITTPLNKEIPKYKWERRKQATVTTIPTVSASMQ